MMRLLQLLTALAAVLAQRDIQRDEEIEAFHNSIRNDDLETATELLHHAGVRTATLHEQTSLHLAATNGHARMITLLLEEADAEVDHVDKDKWSPLMYASFNGHTEAVRTLIAAGASVDLKNEYGMTALKLAAGRNHQDIVKLLVAGGADKAAKDMYGHTAHHYAKQNKHLETAELLAHDEL